MENETLAQAASDLATAAANARSWVHETAPESIRVASEAASLIDVCRRVENASRKLHNAASRRMCIGVFGPSQAGKSYLVSRLCKKPTDEDGPDERLIADVGGRDMDFLREINPPGDKESTGLVTRFSKFPQETPDGYPISLRLLSESDLVKIFANSYLSDFDPNNLELDPPAPGSDETHAIIAELRQAPLAPKPAEHLGELAIHELKEYFANNFKSRLPFLEPCGYWEFAFAQAARLSLADRAKLFRVLWGGIEEFTDLYLKLAEALDKLGHAQEAFAAIEALTPREKSIIDVDRIKLDLGTEADDNDLLPVRGENGVEARLPRAVLCALVAELRINMRNETWPLFDQTDLLDFPGARSREKYRNMREKVESESDLARRPRELFIRGKVAVLFQRYSEERELTSMLLCMAGSNAEVKDLGILVRDWIHSTHGDTPEERSRQRNALFFILTKSDAEFITKEGEDEASRRAKWHRRIYASMIELYERDGWLNDWDGEPFRNTLWLRNPGIEQKHLVAYRMEERDGSKKRAEPLFEVDYAPDIKGRLADIEKDFLSDEAVVRYFKDPKKAFDGLLALNDGGVAYIVEEVTEVCDPKIKTEQVRGRLLRQSRVFLERFDGFYDAGASASREEKLAQARAAAEDVGRALAGEALRPFGRLLDEISAKETELRDIYLTVAHMEEDEQETASPPATAAAASIFDDLDGSETASHSAPKRRDRPELFAERAVQSWVFQVRSFVADETHPVRRDFSGDSANLLAQELISAAHRLGVTEAISTAVRGEAAIASADWEGAAELSACIAGNQINTVVATLGYADAPEAERPQVPPLPQDARRRAFAPPESFESLPELGEKPRPIAREFVQDWLAAFVQLTIDNMGYSEGREISEARNAELGRLIEQARVEPRLAPGD